MDIRKLMEGVTPGPWLFTEGKFPCLFLPNGGDLLDGGELGAAGATANARAIAALPDLLQHALRLEEALDDLCDAVERFNGRVPAMDESLARARAALSNQIHQGDGEANNLPIEGGAMPSAPAVAASPSNPSVSPVPASIRIAGEE